MGDKRNMSKEHSCNVTAKTRVFGECPLPVSIYPHKYHMDDPEIVINVKGGGTYSYRCAKRVGVLKLTDTLSAMGY